MPDEETILVATEDGPIWLPESWCVETRYFWPVKIWVDATEYELHYDSSGGPYAVKVPMHKPTGGPDKELERVWASRGKSPMVITIPWDEWQAIERAYGQPISSHEVRKVILAVFSGDYKLVRA